MKQTTRISHEAFEAMEETLREAGAIDDEEWFCKGGATFLARGVPVHILPTTFNGAEWIVEIETLEPALN